MPSGTNSYAFCADYSSLATCLFAIQTSEENGAFAADAEALKLLSLFEKDVLRKLYLRVLRILGLIDGVDGIPNTYYNGDFLNLDFLKKDFHVGYLRPGAQGHTAAGDFDGRNFTDDEFNVGNGYILGDFEDEDFSYMDFYVGYLDTRNVGYSSTFQTILNIFKEFCRRIDEISDADKAAIDDALIPVLDAINNIQQYLTSKGLNPCTVSTDVYLNNSSSIYLQAAGADGTDGIAEGLHLRWSLTGELGENHLPRGNYNNSGQQIGFNQPDDYVQIYRIAYNDSARVTLNFETSRPVVNSSGKFWTYTINQTVDNQQVTNHIRLKFTDASLYNQLAARVDAGTSFFDFLQQYTGIIELQVLYKSLFEVGFDFRRSAGTDRAVFKAETLCQATDAIGSSDPVHTRKTYIVEDDADANIIITAENIQTIRLKKSPEGILKGFYFETYHDFIIPKPPADYNTVGSFGLSLTDQEVYDRIETAAYPVNDLWPQYNNGTRVRVSNYHDKWAVSRPNEPSLKAAVSRYLTLSETDPRAEDILRDENADPNSPGLQISYIDLLNLQSMDYHIARMLGLGHIDVIPAASVIDKFVYIMLYTNMAGLNNSQVITNRYITPPISKSDHLLPETPLIRPVTYGLPINDQQVNRTFDEQGYTHLDNIRAVNIGRELFSDEKPGYDFFADLFDVNNLNIFEHPKPVLYGVEYRPASKANYVKPEITHEKAIGTQYNAYDDDFPATGVAETVPVPDDTISLYIHFERQAGLHFYAIYGINWFSRASALSDEAATDATVFVPVNTLIPLTDLAVQYIQKEDPLLFTTAIEQDWLNNRNITFPGQDIGFTRITFNWLDITDVSKLQDNSAAALQALTKADKANAFFKPGLPLEIMGIINRIVPVGDSDTQLDLYTVGYALIDGSTSDPRINNEDLFRFTNSLLSSPEGQFQVVSVLNGDGNWPVIRIERAYDITAIEDENTPGNYSAKKSYVSPGVNSRFSMVENLSNQANWSPVAENISLFSFADPANPVIESSSDSEGNESRFWIGGINANATVTPLFSSANGPDDLPGYYRISFGAGVTLAPHPQINLPFDPAFPDKNAPGTLHEAHVEWYKGWIRMPLVSDNADKKLLEVLRIDQTSPLIVYIYDPAYQNDPIVDSAGSQTPVTVNFHPGYRAYLFPEPQFDYALNRDNILPEGDANDRKTLLGLQTADTRPGGSGFASPVSVPAVLHARKIDEPLQLGAPVSPILKVRPDATAKAAFTFDVRVAPAANGSLRKPFGFTFYRTTIEDVFDALYSPATVAQITTDLAALVTDPSFNVRAYELVNLIFDPANFLHFRVFEAEPQPYGFPVPDRAGLTTENDSPAVKIDKYTLAIHQTLLPLTEQTPVYNFIRNGVQTENALPVIRDINGNLLNASDPAFNPFPMVRKYIKDEEPGVTYIRFTDYLLNGSSRNLYFYAGTEVTSQLVPGLLSLFTGPVTILQTLTSDAPLISKFSVQPATISSQNIAVAFQVSPISVEEHISKIRVFRTTDPLKAANLQTMDTSFDREIAEGLRTDAVITDDFADLQVIPAGEVIYYRLVGIRTIINETEQPEEVFSYASEIIPVRLIDTINPVAPVLTYHADTNSLSWPPTANKGTYYLYQQNAKGNWQRIYSVDPPLTSQQMNYQFPAPLVLQDGDGNRIYYRFKVQAQNSSGLFNLVENEITI